MDMIFDFDFETTEFSNDNYLMIGKVLTFATRFEGECKALSILLGIKQNFGTDNFDLDAFVQKLHDKRLFWHISHILKLPLRKLQQTRLLLEKARESRNFIAHELTLGFERIAETDEGRNILQNEIREHVGIIAEAEKSILLLSAILTHEEVPNANYLRNYQKNVIHWVMEV